MEAPPAVWAIVLGYNACKITCDCLRSLLDSDYPNLQVMMVDNASVDDTVPVVKKAFPQIHIIENPENYLFAKGNNIGVDHAMGKGAAYIFILNNDTTVEKQSVGKLVSFLQDQPDCAACQPLIVQMQHPDLVASAGCRVSLSGRAADLFYGERADAMPGHPFQVCGVTGGAVMIRASAISQSGLFCESFKMYFEDVDISLRLREKGHSLYCVPLARVSHYISASTRKKGVFFHTYYTERNSYLVVLRNFPTVQIMKSFFFKIPAAAVSCGFNLLKGNFSYSLAVFLSVLYGMMALSFFLPIRLLQSIKAKKQYPFWPLIESNTLYP